MPMISKIKKNFLTLPLGKKLIAFGSLATFIAVFLPWYSDIDRFEIGETYLGITGPLYLTGILVMASAFVSIALIVLELSDKPLPKLPVSSDRYHIFGAAFSAFMFLIALSVYFHPKFGVNILEKRIGIGIVLGFGGVFLAIIGSKMKNKAKNKMRVSIDEDIFKGVDVVNLTDNERSASGLNNEVNRKVVREEKKEIYDHGSMAVKNAVDDFINDHPNHSS